MNLPVWITDPSRNRINFHEAFELQYFINEWKISEAQLRMAKQKAGTSIVDEIYRQLKKAGLIQEYYLNDKQSCTDEGDFIKDGGK